MPGWQLIRRFLGTSLLLIGLMAVLLGWVTSLYLTHSMLQREQILTVDYIERVAWSRISSAELRQAHQARSDSAALLRVAEELQLLPDVVRLKFYDAQGTVIWSDVPDLVGKNMAGDPGVQKSLQGQVIVELEQITATPEHRFEHPHYRELMSIYVPIHDKATGEVLAVFEIYKYPLALYRLLQQGRLVLWAVALSGGVILLLGQFGLVSGAARTINRQYRDVQQHTTALEQSNARLQATQAQLVQTERLAALGEVTAAVAHGLRNPLGTIRLVAQEVREGLPPQAALREPLEDIMNQVDVLEARLRAFFDTVRPLALTLTPMPLATLIDTALEGLQRHFAARQVRVQVTLPLQAVVVTWDTVKIIDVLQVLLSNSLEAEAHSIHIVGRAGGPTDVGIELRIIDDGTGVTAQVATRVFQPFFTTKPYGTGLGLVIARKIIALHSGQLTLEAQEPGGTCATIWLPERCAVAEETAL